jgi:hypothetical protein
MVDYNAALPQLQQFQAPNALAIAAQANQMQLYQAQLAKTQSDAEMQSKLRSLNRNSPEFVNQLYAIDPAKGLAYEKGVLDFSEAKRKRGEAASDRATAARKEADLEKIYGGFNNLTPAASAAPANNLVAPAEPAVPQMGFGANVGGYTPTAASAAPAASPTVAAPSPNTPDYASVINNLVKGGHIDEAKKIADLAKTSAEGQGKATEASVAKFKAAYEPIQSLLPHVQTPADVEAYTRRLYADPILGAEASKLKPVDQAVQDNLDLVNKVGLDQWRARNSNMDAKQLHELVTSATAPKIEKVDRGGSIVFVDTNPKSPTFNKELNEIQKTPVPKAPGETETPEAKLAFEGKKLEQRSQFELEKAYPVKKASVEATTGDIDAQIARAKALKEHAGLGGITGGVMGRLPSSRAASTSAQADLNQLKAKAGFEALQSMRDRSPTGGALGNVSDTEGRRLEASAAALEQAQSKDDFQIKLDRYIEDLERSKKALKNAFDTQYSGVKTKAAPAKSDGWTIEEH